MSRPQDRHSTPEAAAGDTVYQQIAALNHQAWELSDTDAKQALALSTAAYDLASAPPDRVPPDQEGIDCSLLDDEVDALLAGVKELQLPPRWLCWLKWT